jgi:hypothetical protein
VRIVTGRTHQIRAYPASVRRRLFHAAFIGKDSELASLKSKLATAISAPA